MRLGFNPWVGKIPWRREWLSTPVFLPGEFHGQRNLEGYSLWGCTESDTTEATYHTCHYYSQLLYYCGLLIFSFFALHLFLVPFLVCFSLPSKSESFLYTLQPLFCHLLDVCREATWPPKLPVFRKGPYPLTILPKITYCYWHLVWFCLSVPCLSLLWYHAGHMRAGAWIVLFTGVFPLPRTVLGMW